MERFLKEERMIKAKAYYICRKNGEMKDLWQLKMTKLEAVRFVAANALVGNYSDFSRCVPFTKFIGIDHRPVNDWIGELEGAEEEIFPLFIAAYSIQYIICKSNECITCPKCLEFLPIASKANPKVLEALERQNVKEFYRNSDEEYKNKMINFAMMLAMNIVDEEDIKTGLMLSNEGEYIQTVFELMAENPEMKFREMIQAVA
jgi:hypothetical protein